MTTKIEKQYDTLFTKLEKLNGDNIFSQVKKFK